VLIWFILRFLPRIAWNIVVLFSLVLLELILRVLCVESLELVVVEVLALDAFTDCEILFVEGMVLLYFVRTLLLSVFVILPLVLTFSYQLTLGNPLLVLGLTPGDVALLPWNF